MSTLDGEPREELHEHYDPDGNLTGTTVVTAPGWSDTDRSWALGLMLHDASRCPRGHDLAESTDYGWRWVPDPPLVCLACLALDAAAKTHEKDPRHRAFLYSVQKVPRPKPGKPKRR